MRIYTIVFFLILSHSGFSQDSEKRILFKGDSIWYAAENQILFSSTTKGLHWDTIFAKRNQTDTVFFAGALDTASNVFITDQKTLVVFAWDGTLHFKTIVFCSADCGKTWNKTFIHAENGVIGIKYFHKISANRFFIDCRYGAYLVSDDSGKTWRSGKLTDENSGCRDEHFIFCKNGDIWYDYFLEKDCKVKFNMVSRDGGATWHNLKR